MVLNSSRRKRKYSDIANRKINSLQVLAPGKLFWFKNTYGSPVKKFYPFKDRHVGIYCFCCRVLLNTGPTTATFLVIQFEKPCLCLFNI